MYEGFRDKIYDDVAGKATIGYGHLLKPGEHYNTITKEQATELLREDVGEAENGVNHLVHVLLHQGQFDALVSFVYNLGYTNFAKSSLLWEINAEHHYEVPTQLCRWHKAGGKPVKGLLLRRIAEAEMYISEL